MTGIAIVLYLNQTPSQPRERDYAYAGSFYAFAIWIGMGVAGIIRLLQHYAKMKELPAAAIVSVACLFVPIQMASQTWDDHDRSGRYVARDFGQNYLMSLQETGNPIIYTNGDNDTFPLWYNQETEGFRTDARTCNLSYLQTDWYIDQMKRPAYDSPSLPITWDRMEYVEGTNEYVPVRPEYKKSIDALYAEAEKQALSGNTEALVNVKKEFGENPYELKNILKYWIRSKNEDLKVIPTDSIVMKVDKEAVRRSGMMIPATVVFRALYPQAIFRMDPNERAVYLTFDDGPIPEVTPWVLELLEKHNIKATFFMVGDNIKKHPDEYRMVVEHGHRIGNHTFNHIRGFEYSNPDYLANAQKVDEIIHSDLFRPPHGHMGFRQYYTLRYHYRIIMWDLVTRDYSKRMRPEQVLNNVKRYARNGSIITFHDS